MRWRLRGRAPKPKCEDKAGIDEEQEREREREREMEMAGIGIVRHNDCSRQSGWRLRRSGVVGARGLIGDKIQKSQRES